ncbi:hypothetical protein C8R46DRAFT_1199019 [Mycena filopes]|nr:hypothetical protein C8R46DRAFT_1199019 [Mycena filopes]
MYTRAAVTDQEFFYDNTTPTQPQRYSSSSRDARYEPASEDTRELLHRLLGMVENLNEHTQQFDARLTALESRMASSTSSAPPPARGLAASRGKARRGKARSRTVGPPNSDTSDADAESIDPALRSESESATDTDGDADDADDAFRGGDLSKAANRALQSYVTKTFRRVCHVSGKDWPDPDVVRINPVTHETYPSPFFAFEISDPRNQRLIGDVARQVDVELRNPECWPSALKECDSDAWDINLLIQMAKNSFGSFRKQWNGKTNPVAGLKAEKSAQAYRQEQRRNLKSKQLKSISAEYLKTHDIDPEFLEVMFDAQFMSDEVSGPEDEAIEVPHAWKVRMAAMAGMSLTPASLSKVNFLEVTSPDWRSETYSDIIHDFQRRFFKSLSDADKRAIKYHRVGTGRVSSRIPEWAPYNFGIASDDWLKSSRQVPVKRNLLKQWGKYPDPDDLQRVLDAIGDDIEEGEMT